MSIESPAVVITAIVLALAWEIWALWRARRAPTLAARLLILVDAQFMAVMGAALGLALAMPLPSPLSSVDVVTLHDQGVPQELVQRLIVTGRELERLDLLSTRLMPVMVLLLLMQLPMLALRPALLRLGGHSTSRPPR